MAKADFLQVQKVWKHSSLPIARKLQIYGALIASKLMYSLSCLCLSAAELRLDGLQNRCPRRILGIRPTSVSRISNACVLLCAGCQAATDVLLKRQLLLFGKVLRYPVELSMHQMSFIPGTLQPATSRYIRRVGRPRREWISEVRNKAYEFGDGHREVTRLAQNPLVWRDLVSRAISVHAPPGV